jgi:hypothetical protein
LGLRVTAAYDEAITGAFKAGLPLSVREQEGGMQSADVTVELSQAEWAGPFGAEDRARAVAGLEDGRVVVLPRLAFPLLPEEGPFLDAGTLDNTRKNISYDPRTGACSGSGYDGAELVRLSAMLQRYGAGAEALMAGLFPHYGNALERARTSFRPAEISGREYSPRHDDRRLHVDAFPTRPTHGRRILRVFTNVAPQGVARHWRVGEPFADFARAFLPRTGRLFPGQAQAMATLGLTKGRRSAYDHAMLGLHDSGKLDARYQKEAPRAELFFAPGTTWMCFTDQVLHAALAGRCAFEQTFHLPVAAMVDPEKSPVRILERLAGRALV